MAWARNNESICNTGLFLVDNVKVYIITIKINRNDVITLLYTHFM